MCGREPGKESGSCNPILAVPPADHERLGSFFPCLNLTFPTYKIRMNSLLGPFIVCLNVCERLLKDSGIL